MSRRVFAHRVLPAPIDDGSKKAPGGKRWAMTLLAGVIALAALAAPGSMAYLQSSVQAEGLTLTTGSAELAISDGSGGVPILLPNSQLELVNSSQPAQISNDGTVPLDLSVSLTGTETATGTFGATVTIAVWTASTGSGCSTSSSETKWTGTVNTPSSASLGVLDPGDHALLCIAASLPTGAAAPSETGATAQFTITVTAKQVQ